MNKSVYPRIVVVAAVGFMLSLWACQGYQAYKDTSLSFEKRVEDLVGRMTLEEKVSQMSYESPAIKRLDIPEYNWWNECLHGVARSGLATVFPQAIGMAAMWDKEAMYEVATVISDEARAKHHDLVRRGKREIYGGLTFWTPNINIFRDPRWGRGMETYGEDPYLTGELGVSFIKGLQGNDSVYYKLIATAKHFAVHSGPEFNRHRFNALPSLYDFKETYTPQFEKAVTEAGVYSVMCAYNRLDGQPCCGNEQLSALLRSEWGFKGYIVSDCWAVKDFYTQDAHEVVNTRAEAAAMSVLAGTDLNCGSSYPALVEAVENGYLSEEDIDISVKRLFLARMKLGMFDPEDKVPYATITMDVVNSEQHRLLALETARKSMVLLQNRDKALPWSKNINKVAVIGPNANDVEALLGNYNGYPSHPVTPLQGIRNKLPGAEVLYARGCSHAEGFPYLEAIPETVLFTDSTLSVPGLKGNYYNGLQVDERTDFERIDKGVDFKWWEKGPGEGVDAKSFAVQWTGCLVPEVSGEYCLGIEGLNEISLWLDGELIVTHDSEHHPVRRYEKVQLTGGQKYHLKLVYRQKESEYAVARLLWEKPQDQLMEKAMAVAEQSDAIVLCMGLSPLLEGEEMEVDVEGFAGGDRVSIELPAVQQKLIQSVMALNKPAVLVLMNGSAIALNGTEKQLPAILEAWYPGQDGGTAIADVLFGDYNPSGRLPLTFYQSTGQLPDFENYGMEGRTYRYFDGEPLYAFGHGLSYTRFEYDDLTLPERISAGQPVHLSVNVTNAGMVEGDEVVQLYVSHPDSEIKKAIRSLKAFTRIRLKPGETKNVSFKLEPEDLALLDNEVKYIIDGHAIAISVGGCQPDAKALNVRQVIMDELDVELINNEIYVVK